jgi:TatD DNase family protein
MNLIDVHAHMDYPPLDKRIDEVVANAKAKGVKVIISNGTSPESNRNVKKLSEDYEIIKPAYGFYPTHVQEVTEEEFDAELKWIEENKPIAIGEVGLDYKFGTSEHPSDLTEEQKQELIQKQKKGFQKIINLAKKLNVPLIVHSRKAELDAIEMLEESGYKKIVMHCFMGKKKYVKRIQENGWSFSIPTLVLYLEQTQEVVRTTPLANLFTETDAPLLSPEPGMLSEPANVALSIKKIAELKGMTTEETADQIFMNYQRLFL